MSHKPSICQRTALGVIQGYAQQWRGGTLDIEPTHIPETVARVVATHAPRLSGLAVGRAAGVAQKVARGLDPTPDLARFWEVMVMRHRKFCPPKRVRRLSMEGVL